MPPPSGEKRKQLSVDEAIAFFTNKQSSSKVRGNLPLTLSLEKLEVESGEHGLPEDTIITLLDVACSLKFPESISTRLVKCLIPCNKVPEQAAIKCISWLCTNNCSSNMQALLMKWLILVYELLDATEKFHMLYTFIFYFLEDEVICPYACHLLYLITRKEDVKAFRIRSLIQLQSKMGQQPYIQGLLSVYKLYCPHLVAVSIPASLLRRQHGFFKQVDRRWAAKIRSVQDASGSGAESGTASERLTDAAGALSKLPAAKRRRSDIIPQTTTSVNLPDNNASTPRHLPAKLSAVPFAQVKSFKQLLKNMDRLELPSQLAAALHNTNLQHVLLCYPDPAIPLRIGNWLDQVLNQEFFNQGAYAEEDPRCEHLLRLLIHFSDFLQEGVPVCEHFLARYLHVWNGQLYAPLLLKLITRFRLNAYSVLHDLVFEPLRKLFFCSSVYFKCQILRCFTLLLQNFASAEYPRYLYGQQLDIDRNHRHNVADSVPLHNFFSVFSEESTNFDALDTIRQFIQFVNAISSVGLQAEADNTLLMHYVLDFFDVASTLYSVHGVPVVEIAGPGVVYKAMFTSDPCTLSRLADLINTYRVDCHKLKEEQDEVWRGRGGGGCLGVKKTIHQLNGYIIDVSNTLWTDKAFFTPKPKGSKHLLQSVYQHFPAAAAGALMQQSRSVFCLHQHQAQLGLVRHFITETQPKDARPHPRSLKASRDVFMDFLCRESMAGIVHFINNNIHRR